MGVMCGVCEPDYYFEAGSNTCIKCEGGKLSTTTLVCIIVVAVILVIFFLVSSLNRFLYSLEKIFGLSFAGNSEVSLAMKKLFISRREETSQQYQSKLKQWISLYQIATAFPSTLATTFPAAYMSLSSKFNVLDLGIFFKSIGFSCSFTVVDYMDILVVSTSFPVLFSCALYVICYIHVYIVKQYSEPLKDLTNVYDRVDTLRATYFYLFLFFTYLILPGVTTVVFNMLTPCIDVDPENVVAGQDLYLPADLSVHCIGDRYGFGVLWAILSVIVYPIGIPCMYFYLLYSSRHFIRHKESDVVPSLNEVELNHHNRMQNKLSALRFLHQDYPAKFWYFEIVETYRKLCLTSVLSVISPGSTKQMVIGVLFSAFCLVAYAALRPFADRELTVTNFICQLQLCLILFVSILIKEEVHISETFPISTLVGALIFVPVYEAVLFLLELPVKSYLTAIGLKEKSGVEVNASKSSVEVAVEKLDLESEVVEDKENYARII